MDMAQQSLIPSLEQIVKEKVEKELENLGKDSSRGSKTVKDVAAAIMPGVANIISVAVLSAVSTAVSTVVKDITDKLLPSSAEFQKVNLLHRYDNDRLEQYTRSDNLRIIGIEEDQDEDEDVLQAKVLEIAADIGVKLNADDISIAHRLGKAGERSRPVIVRFCQRKKRNAVLKNKKELKKKNKKVYINEDLTTLRSALLKMAKEKTEVRNVTTRDGRILAWLVDKERPVVLTTPDDLHKIGIDSPDWKRLKLDHLVK